MRKYLLLLPFICSAMLLKAQTDTVSRKISQIPYKHVDAIAKFTHGDFKNYITTNLQINHKVAYSVKGQIILLMSIDAAGSIAHVTILKSLSPQIDPEVVKVIYASPKWQPATLNGQNVSMDMVLNIDIAVNGAKQPDAKPISTKQSITTKPVVPVVKPPAAVIKQAAPLVAKKTITPIANKPVPVIIKKPTAIVAKKPAQPVIKKTTPVIAKKVVLPIVKKPEPVIAKKLVPPVVKKPEPVIAKKVAPPIVKKPEPVIAKKAAPPIVKKPEPVIAKKLVPPVVKKPAAPVIAKKVATPVLKKPEPIVAKKVVPPVVKKPDIVKPQITAKNAEPIPNKKPKRVIVKMNLFHPSSHNAEFPGGLSAFLKYLGENIVYPPDSKKAGVQGKVFISFTIEEDGTVSEVEALSSPAEDLSQEAIRVLLASPKWKPASQNGRNVAVSYTIPINFTLTDKQN